MRLSCTRKRRDRLGRIADNWQILECSDPGVGNRGIRHGNRCACFTGTDDYKNGSTY